MESPWNSLEIVNVIISLLIPIVGGIIAWRLAKFGKEIDKIQFTNQKIIEKRLEFYDNVVPKINDLYCYYYRVGNWKELTPPEVIEMKRYLDKQFYIYSHIFKNKILIAYQTFIHNCFKTYNGWGENAKIIMDLSKRSKLPDWQEEWNNEFEPDLMVGSSQFKSDYFNLLNMIRDELDIE